MDRVECEGKTIEEAADAALRSLGIAREDADIEVIQQPSAGFFGFFRRKARVAVSRRAVKGEETSAPPVEETEVPQESDAPAKAEHTEADTPVAEPGAPRTESARPHDENRERERRDCRDYGERREHRRREPREEFSFQQDLDSVTAMTLTEAQEQQAQRAVDFLQEVTGEMDVEVDVHRYGIPSGILLRLTGEDLGILIGKHGQTLDALQYLTNLAANRGVDEGRLHILVDVENYRAHREEMLMRLADHLAEKACRTGQDIRLEPMNRHERRIIHTELVGDGRVMTYSAGDEPRRFVVIAPKRRRG